ncbi:MAG: galactokinase [Acidobacteriaceae bacterium]|jgi:galactokinase/mevalonate kinase-like predicted kinase|nr:galactokinase [Acidobacteriaceae bacterium]
MHSLTQTPTSPERLAEEACQIELDRLQKLIGKQDQYMAAFGGLTALHIEKDGRVKASRLCLSVELLEALESNMLLFYTGAARDTVNILEKQDNDTKKKNGVSLIVFARSRTLESTSATPSFVAICTASASYWTFWQAKKAVLRHQQSAD